MTQTECAGPKSAISLASPLGGFLNCRTEWDLKMLKGCIILRSLKSTTYHNADHNELIQDNGSFLPKQTFLMEATSVRWLYRYSVVEIEISSENSQQCSSIVHLFKQHTMLEWEILQIHSVGRQQLELDFTTITCFWVTFLGASIPLSGTCRA